MAVLNREDPANNQSESGLIHPQASTRIQLSPDEFRLPGDYAQGRAVEGVRPGGGQPDLLVVDSLDNELARQ